MRTVHLLRKYNPAEWGGTETAVQRLFDGLRTQGVTPVVYCPKLDAPSNSDPLLAAGYQIERFRAFVPIWGISRQQKRQMISVGGNLMSFELLASLWREENISVIHAHTLGRIACIGLTVARQRQIPFIVTIHGGVLDLPPQSKKNFNAPARGGLEWGKVFSLLFQAHRFFRDADAIITCNQNEARLLRDKYPDKRIIAETHAIPLALYQQDHQEEAVRAFPQIQGKQALLCVGRIDPIKNQAWLVDQAPRIFEKHSRAILVLVGACTDEVYGEDVNRKIRQLGLQDRVLRTGGLPPNDPRLIGLLQEAAAVVLPSVSETFGLVILEAWATGTPVLASRTSGACALVRDGHNGRLFDLEQPESFHRALDQTLGESETAKQLARRGGDQVSVQFDIRVVAGRMKNLYAELIEEKHALCNYS